MPSPEQRLAPGKSDDHRAISVGPKEVAIRHGPSAGFALHLVLTAIGIYVFISTLPMNGARATPSDVESAEADTVQDRGPPFLPCGC